MRGTAPAINPAQSPPRANTGAEPRAPLDHAAPDGRRNQRVLLFTGLEARRLSQQTAELEVQEQLAQDAAAGGSLAVRAAAAVHE